MLTRRPNRRLLQRLDAADAVFRTTGDGSARRDANNAAHRTRHHDANHAPYRQEDSADL